MDNQSTSHFNLDIKFLLTLLAVLMVFLGFSLLLRLRVERGDRSSPTKTTSASFPIVALSAEAAYVYDVRAKEVIFAKNEKVRLPLASLTKLMAALVADDLATPGEVVTIDNQALKIYGDNGFNRGEKWSLRDILDFSLMTSSNDGIRAAALTVGSLLGPESFSAEKAIDNFVVEMNRKAAELNLANTYFGNETGLDLSFEGSSAFSAGAYGTAEDMARLLEYILIYHPNLLEATKYQTLTFHSLDGKVHIANNTNRISSEIPGLVASKTGFTDAAGGNLAIVFDPELGHPFILIVLGSTEEGRFEDMKTLISAVMGYIQVE